MGRAIGQKTGGKTSPPLDSDMFVLHNVAFKELALRYTVSWKTDAWRHSGCHFRMPDCMYDLY